MLSFNILLVLLIQGSFIFAELEDLEDGSQEILEAKPEEIVEVEVVKELKEANKDFMDMFLGSGTFFPTSSVTLMTQATNSDKMPDEQIEEIKDMGNKIAKAIQSEIANLLSFALLRSDKESKNSTSECLRKKRSAESPIDSTQLVTRLLNHIKHSNEYQNIAIEKMMSAQEIANKYGIPFQPDEEILSDLAEASNNQVKELSSIMQEVYDVKNETTYNETKIEFVPIVPEKEKCNNVSDNNTYYSYSINNEQSLESPNLQQVPTCPVNQVQPESQQTNYETQIPSPNERNSSPVSLKPNFYEIETVTPIEYYPCCSFEPVGTTPAIFIPETIEPEPELLGEVHEETVSSKVIVDHEEPGTATVNHMMTYTTSEKSYFRTPEIEKLPQQMQYSFFLI